MTLSTMMADAITPTGSRVNSKSHDCSRIDQLSGNYCMANPVGK